MEVHDPFDDPILGPVTFDQKAKEWLFTVTIAGREIDGRIVPEDESVPLEAQGLEEIRQCVVWIRDHEPSIREYITDQMFEGWQSGWYDEEIDTITTPDEFREAISLSGFSVLEDRIATLYYNDGGLFGEHCIVLSVGADGHYTYPPEIWG